MVYVVLIMVVLMVVTCVLRFSGMCMYQKKPHCWYHLLNLWDLVWPHSVLSHSVSPETRVIERETCAARDFF